jgi:hypothetical protein
LRAKPCIVTPRWTDADRRDLVLGERSAHPDAAAALDAVPLDAEAGEHVDQDALESPHVRDDVDRFAQAHDGIADELAGTVPGDLAAAVDVDDGGAVGRPLVPRRARAAVKTGSCSSSSSVSGRVPRPHRRGSHAVVPTRRGRG